MAVQQQFTEVARTLKSVMNPNHGYALLMRLDGQYHYASIANRADVHASLTEWLACAEAKVNVRDPGETTERSLDRMRLEAKCTELGHLLEAEGHRGGLFPLRLRRQGAPRMVHKRARRDRCRELAQESAAARFSSRPPTQRRPSWTT